MPTCDHCGAEFDDGDAYLAHLAAEHEGDLGAIERRRVANREADASGGGIPTGPAVLGLVVLFALAIVVYVVFAFGGGSTARAGEPGAYGSDHGHGTINVTVLGDRIDFSQARYQVQADRFHFEGGNGRVWHTHASGVTLQWGMATLGIDVTASSVTYRGTTYRDNDSAYDVSVTVDGEPVDPATYVLDGASEDNPQAGDHVRIVVTEA